MRMKKMAPSAEAQHRLMTQTPMARLIASMALPTVASQLITIVYNTADTYFVSHIDTSASAAVGVAFSLMSIIHAFGFGVSMGSGALVSKRLGEKKDEDAAVYTNSGLALTVALGFVILALGLPFVSPLMTLLGSTESMLGYSCDYARWILLAAPISCASFLLNNVMRAEGKAVLSMVGLCAGGIINIALDPLFIFTFGLGISGAALATAASQTVSFCVLFSFYLMKKTIIRLDIRKVSRKARTYLDIARVGFPTVCRQGMASVASALLNNAAGVYGDYATAAVTIANKVYMLVRNVVLGIGQGFQPVAGYNFGYGDKARVKKAFKVSCVMGSALCVAAALVIFPFSDGIIGWFRDDPDVISVGGRALRYFCIAMPFLAYSTFVNQMYQCLGFTAVATLLASCRQGIFFIPYILIMPSVIGIAAIETVQPATDLLTFLVSIPFHIWFFKKVLGKNTA